MQINLAKRLGQVSLHDDIRSTGKWKMLLVEYLFNLATPLPFYWNLTVIEHVQATGETTTHRVNDFFLCIMFLRVYTVVRFILTSSLYMNTRAARVCNMNGCRAGYLFAIKCLVKEKPVTVIVINLLISVVCFGYGTRMFDLHLYAVERFDNSFWMSIITMTSVGYGDLYPISLPSKILGVFCAFWGVYLTSLFVNSVSNFLITNESDDRSYMLINAIQEKEAMKTAAVKVIIAGYRQKQAKKLHPKSKNRQFWAFKLLRHRMMQFKTQAMIVRQY
jgi:hypothetical protein